MATINLPVFRLSYNDIRNLPKGLIGNKPKLLLVPQFPNLNQPGNMELLAYFTKTHTNYAEDTKPLSIFHTSGNFEALESNLVIGNNDITIKKLLRTKTGPREWTYAEIFPFAKIVPGNDPNPHLAFKFIFHNTVAEIDPVILAEPVYSNPSPPAKPSDEELEP